MTIFDLTLLYYSKNKCEILFKRRSLKSLRGPVFIHPATWNYRTLETFSLNIACAKLKIASRQCLFLQMAAVFKVFVEYTCTVMGYLGAFLSIRGMIFTAYFIKMDSW